MKNCIFLYLFSYLLFTSCNVTEQTQIDRNAASGITTISFSYTNNDISLIQNTTTMNIIPSKDLGSAYYQISPTLPTGIFLNPNTGEIYGRASVVFTKTEYVIKATTASGIEFANIEIEVTEEPVKTISFTNSNLNYIINNYATFTPSTTGGTPLSFSISPTLPTGMTIDTSTGEISGTPTAIGSGYYNVSATNSSGTATTAIYIYISDIAPTGLSYSNDAQVINIGDPLTLMSPSLTNSPASVTYSIKPTLPNGLSLNQITGEISGTPTGANGITNYTMTAYNTAGSISYALSLRVNNPAQTLTYAMTTFEVQQGVNISPIQVSSYVGGKPVVYSLSCDVTCPSNITLTDFKINSSTGLISGKTSAAVGVYPLIITATESVNGTTTTATIDFEVVENYPDNSSHGFASAYTIYKDVAVANTIKPSNTTGLSSAFSAGALPAGLAINALTGEITGTPTSLGSATYTISGTNLDKTNNPNIITVQTITINVEELKSPTLGYTNTSSPYYDATTKIFKLQNGNNTSVDILPNIPIGYTTPSSYTISPTLPGGLALDPNTGEITVNPAPTEIVPVKYYTITGSYIDGSKIKESIAISTNVLIAPQSLTYGGGTNDLAYTIYTYQSETPTYVGSQGTYSVTPTLPTGLALNTKTGVIAGTPLVGLDAPNSYTIKVSNYLGSVSTIINISITNTAPSDLRYYTDSSECVFTGVNSPDGYDCHLVNPITFTEGDLITTSTISHDSDYENNSPAGLITNYADLSGFLISRGLTLNTSNGNISGTAIATDARELTPAAETISITGSVDTDPTLAGSALSTTNTTFNLLINEKKPSISYGSGTNIITLQSNSGVAENIVATNAGGLIALTSGGVPTSLCTATEANPAVAVDPFDLNSGGSPFIFNAATCSFQYDGSACFDNDANPLTAPNGATYTYDILARNSGSPLGETTRITLKMYDGPRYTYEPDGTNFSGETNLNLTNTLTVAARSYTPTLNACHIGDFELDDLSDLPTGLTFSATNGQIATTGDYLVGRRSFSLYSEENLSGLSLRQDENITVQASHVQANGGVSDYKFSIQKFDINLDGTEDIILRNMSCDDAACAANATSTAVYLQSSATSGLFQGTISALPVTSDLEAIAVSGIQYDSLKAGVLWVNSSTTTLRSQSTTDSESTTVIISSAGRTKAIVPLTTGITTAVGVVQYDAGAITIDQFDINGNSLSSVTASATLPYSVNSEATGGLDLSSQADVSIVKNFDSDGDGNQDIIIGYRDSNGTNRICGLFGNGTSFSTSCSPRLDIPNNGTIKEIKFANVVGDSLEDMVVLANDGTNNTIYVYENQNNYFVGLYQAVDVLTLKTNNTNVDFDLSDINGDGYIDIVSNDILTGGVVAGFSVYYHGGAVADIYKATSVQDFPDVFDYHLSTGNTNDIEIIDGGSSKFILHCQVDTVAGNQNSSCGIMGAF